MFYLVACPFGKTSTKDEEEMLEKVKILVENGANVDTSMVYKTYNGRVGLINKNTPKNVKKYIQSIV